MDADYLARLFFPNTNQVTAGAHLRADRGASVGIAVSIYPVLKKWNAGLALGSVFFRTIEAVMYIAGAVSLLSLVSIGHHFTTAAAADRGACLRSASVHFCTTTSSINHA